MNILKIFTYAGCSQDYWDHIMSYPSNEDSLKLRRNTTAMNAKTI